MENKEAAVMALRVIAATAAKAAHDLEHNKLWEGELSVVVQTISKQLSDVRE